MINMTIRGMMWMESERKIMKIPINCIRQNLNQPRKYFNQDSLMELADSIREYGLLQPISVRKIDKNVYELIAGERRLRASQLAGLTEIPAIITDIKETDSAFLALIENLQREDLNFFEEAEGYENLIKQYNFTQEELAVKLGKRQSTVANKMRILKLPENVKEKIKSENLTERHARALLRISDEKVLNNVLNEVIKKRLNVKGTEELIEKVLSNDENGSENKKSNKPKFKWAISPRIITNTIKQIMDKNGIVAEYSSHEKEDYLEITVKIPKTKRA